MEHRHHAHAHLHHHRRNSIDQVSTFIHHERSMEDLTRLVPVEEHAAAIVSRDIPCQENDSRPQCEKPQGSRALPIALASTLPIVVAIIVFIFLHQRHKKKVRLEDNDDKHRSLDYGMDPDLVAKRKARKAGKKGNLQVDTQEKKGHVAGMSMDYDVGSPYVLPARMNSSRESFHSLSRSITDNHDPYRPVTNISNNDGPYARGLRPDNASSYTGSSRGTNGLLRGASPMGRSMPQRTDSMPTSATDSSPPIKFPETSHPPDSAISGIPPLPMLGSPAQDSTIGQNDSYFGSIDGKHKSDESFPLPAAAIIRKSLPQEPQIEGPGRDSVSSKSSHPSINGGLPNNPRPVRLQSMEAPVHNTNQSVASVSSDYGDHFKVTPPSPIVETTIELPPNHPHVRQSLDEATPPVDVEEAKGTGLGVSGMDAGGKRYSMSIRPLPPDDPTENPEERANRIRSFYREYFDDSKPDPIGQYGDWHDDNGQEYLDGAIFDPDSGRFVIAGAPYAQPVTRRAMTPPPRAPPRFGSKGHFSSGSSARYGPPRGQSAMSARGAPRKPLPPPSSLKSLPTPHMLKDDNNLFTALDFAPPVSYRDRQAGRRPDSPVGTPRPYSPAVRAFVPLESPFAELKAMPSPHMLRNSKTFTALDFAPNSHLLKTPDSNSDARSVMSSRSGVSRMQLHNIRAGAYRVSRIPNSVVGTVDDIATALKPQWDLGHRA